MITRSGSPIRPLNTSGIWARAKPIPPEKRDYRHLGMPQTPDDDKPTYQDLAFISRSLNYQVVAASADVAGTLHEHAPNIIGTDAKPPNRQELVKEI
jgi:hypothetical protein